MRPSLAILDGPALFTGEPVETDAIGEPAVAAPPTPLIPLPALVVRLPFCDQLASVFRLGIESLYVAPTWMIAGLSPLRVMVGGVVAGVEAARPVRADYSIPTMPAREVR